MNITKITGISSGARERVRELIRIRDNHTCQICGKKWDGISRRLDVHHKDCVKEKTRQCDSYEKEKDNMITLCHKCHLNLPEHRSSISKGVLKALGGKKEKKPTHRDIVESFIGRGLKRDELVLHIDGDKSNNNIKNLIIRNRKTFKFYMA